MDGAASTPLCRASLRYGGERVSVPKHRVILPRLLRNDSQRRHTGSALVENVLFAMLFSASHPNHVPEERLWPVMHEHVLQAAEPLLAARADVVTQPHIVAEVAQSSGQVVLFTMQRLASVA